MSDSKPAFTYSFFDSKNNLIQKISPELPLSPFVEGQKITLPPLNETLTITIVKRYVGVEPSFGQLTDSTEIWVSDPE